MTGAVLYQPRGAVGALHPVAAMAAQGQRRVTAAIEEQHCLLAASQCLPHGLDQWRSQEASAVRRGLPQIDQLDFRQSCAAMPAGQAQVLVSPGLDVHDCLQAGRCRDQHRRARAQPSADDGHVAGIVDDAVLLLERGLMLLIHHHQAEVGKRQEQGRTGADNHGRRALRDGLAGDLAGAWRQIGMPHRGGDAETALKPLGPLRRQGDFGQHHERLTTGAQTCGDGLQVDLGLTRAGDTVQQRDRKPTARDGRPQHAGSPGLLG